MSKFNLKTSNKTVNRAGGEAYIQSDELSFISLLLTSFCKEQFYRSEENTNENIIELISKLDKEFVAKCAIFARNEFGMRSISHIVAGEIAKSVKGKDWPKRFFDKVVRRPDDITEILSYYLSNYGKPIPNSLKKGLGNSFDKFNEYQLAKYRGDKKGIHLIDAVNLIHPKVNENVQNAIKKLVGGTLKSTDTWEVELTKAGHAENTDLAKNKAWANLIKERKIGYFALLRNLRNIIEQSPEVLDEALKLLVDEKLISKSLVLPFRFLTAIQSIEELNGSGVSKTLVALNRAVDISLRNVPKFDGDTLVVLDVSGSMEGETQEIGSLFSAVLVKSNNADFITFSDDAQYRTLNPMDSTLTLAKSIAFTSGGTNFHSIFETANRKYDRIIILSDMQGWVDFNTPKTSFTDYKIRTNADPKVYSFDLQGYGDMQFPERNVFCLTGFSEKIFDVMKLLEEDKNALLNRIKEIEL